MEVAARDFAYSLARTYIGALLCEHAAWKEASPTDIAVATRYGKMRGYHFLGGSQIYMEVVARDLAYSLARMYNRALLCEHAA